MSEPKLPHGTFCWNELVTRDRTAASKFYTELLGWGATEASMTEMPYTVFKAAGKDAAGMMDMPPDVPPQVPSHWKCYIAVDNIDDLVEKTKKLGGQILHGPQDIPEVGRFCIIQDPAGAVVSLVTMVG